MSFSHMQTMINVLGGTIRGAKIRDGQILMKDQLQSDPSYRDNFYKWQFGVDKSQHEQIPIKLYKEKFSNVEGVTVSYNSLIEDKLLIGDVIYDRDKEEYWLVTQSYNRDDILADGLLRKINNWLKWQNAEGDIFEYPTCAMNTTQYNSGEAGNEQIQLGSAQHVLFLPADVNTIMIDHGLRIFLDRNVTNPTVYKVTQNDTSSLNFEKGIVKVTVSEDEFKNGVDRIDLWLCDYKEPTTPQSVTITYSGQPTVRVGMAKTFTASDSTAVFSANLDTDIASSVTLQNKGNGICDISVALNQRIIGKSFELKATAESGDTGEIAVTITGGV